MISRRNEMRWEHLANDKPISDVRPFRREDTPAGVDEATGSDHGDAIVSVMIAYLRERNSWLLPLERLAHVASLGWEAYRLQQRLGLAHSLFVTSALLIHPIYGSLTPILKSVLLACLRYRRRLRSRITIARSRSSWVTINGGESVKTRPIVTLKLSPFRNAS